jgi:hypothetical protein
MEADLEAQSKHKPVHLSVGTYTIGCYQFPPGRFSVLYGRKKLGYQWPVEDPKHRMLMPFAMVHGVFTEVATCYCYCYCCSCCCYSTRTAATTWFSQTVAAPSGTHSFEQGSDSSRKRSAGFSASLPHTLIHTVVSRSQSTAHHPYLIISFL